ncbi:unnamed protein product [marine sediment metagenome]|uniref:Uncharacterized protein n=1 Tax=marine sediment metagenome TaxID=412755 RepID=X1IST1_9ZZZZ
MNIKEQLDSYREFKENYFKILKDFNFNYQKDCESRNYLFQILKEKTNDWNPERVLNSF